MIVAAFAGTGKSTLAAKYPDRIADFVCMPYKYYLDPESDSGEAEKASFENVMREDWPCNYVEAIKVALGEYETILIPSDTGVLKLLEAEGLLYTLCYPERAAKDEYEKRFIVRGNSENFLSIFIGGWNRFMDALERDAYGKHIVLGTWQYLSDIPELTK